MSSTVTDTDPEPVVVPAVKVTTILPLTEPEDPSLLMTASPPVAMISDEPKPASALKTKVRSTLRPVSTFEAWGGVITGDSLLFSHPVIIRRMITVTADKKLFIIFDFVLIGYYYQYFTEANVWACYYMEVKKPLRFGYKKNTVFPTSCAEQ
jgi:hypothetical protein